ncbi:MAG TPA: sterol desaturase family protein [Ferrovibrio sp.]|jgi:sterol desaturase/sphingolipid hydroxylase (fatty acid hydroxylase superfamily)|uniref:sterol desaturase family protein n=1 Tax=Ferrovibrio sp. TaxID=1917215 RepID=UPI002ECFFE38
MTAAILSHEPAIRLTIYFGLLAILMAWEWLAPRRRLALGRWRRWPSNLGMAALNTLALRLVSPAAAVGVAVWAEQSGIGLFNMVAVPAGVAVAVSVLALDLLIYAQHVAFHKIGPLWRLHRMHHADLDIDVTTGARFHTVEILLSMGLKVGAVLLLGAPALAVLLFEVLLNATSMFNHANIVLPPALDRVLRLIVVTPDMHRIHHSWHRDETDSNFGFNLPWWDRLFSTYRAQPRDGHQAMTIGLPIFRDPRELRLDRMLMQPLRRDKVKQPAQETPVSAIVE